MTQHKSAQTDAVYSLEISSPTSEFQFCFVENLFRLAQSKKEKERIYIFPMEFTEWFTFIFIPWKFASANFDFFVA